MRRFAPKGEEAFDLDLKKEVTTGQLFEILELPIKFKPLIQINGRYAMEDNKLNDGDIVTFSFPIVGG